MLRKIKLQFGSSPASINLDFNPSSLVVFVGPNNSGKSLVLREIAAAVRKGEIAADSKIVEEVDAALVEATAAELLLAGRVNEERTATLAKSGIYLTSYHPVSGESHNHQLDKATAIQCLVKDGEQERIRRLSWVYSHYLVNLDGETRLKILEPKQSVNQIKHPTHVLGRLFTDDVARARVRSIGFKAFGRYLVVDPTSLANFEVRLSEREPLDSTEEQALDERARKFHAAALPISSASDGVKAFLGLVSAVFCADHKLALVDEPEAFLHPPLARDLGLELAKNADEAKGQVFVATHSAHFLMGAIESGVSVDIVRLTYDGKIATARIIKANDLIPLMRDPLLRSTGMLSALFHSSAIVCEGDLDRSAYSELDRRLSEAGDTSSKDAVYLSAHGKDALHRIVGPLRRLGIPAVAVADLDMIQEGLFGELLKSCGIPDGVWQAKSSMAGRVAAACARDDVSLKQVGVKGAPQDVKPLLETLVAEVREWGLFLVPCGELERWLPELSISAKTKRGWLYTFFEKIGSDVRASSYVRPGTGDVWDFLRAIAAWVSSPSRKGMPS